MKRFYKEVTVEPGEGGWLVMLDGKPIHTPGRKLLNVPKQVMAEAIAEEWRAQGEIIDKDMMPLTAYAALTRDVVADNREGIIAELLEYGETDLLLYREDQEMELQRQQAEHWQRWLDWASERYGTRYTPVSGIMPVTQPPENREIYHKLLQEQDDWRLALLAVLVKASGSLLLGWAFLHYHLDAYALLRLSRLEEDYNLARWGEDAEARIRKQYLAEELDAAQRWRGLLASQ